MTRLDDRGSVTVEAALALSSLIIVAAAIIGAIATMSAKLAAVDAAAAAARAHAIGVTYEPPAGTVTARESGGLVTVTAEVPAVFGAMTAQAIVPVETAP